MTFFFHEDYVAPLPDGHHFPMGKYMAARQALGGLLPDARVIAPQPLDPALAARVHDAAYVHAVVAAAVPRDVERRIGFGVTPRVARRALLSASGTLMACRAALAHGFAANLAGGSHHAMPAHGAGYCVFNDLAIAARALLASGEVGRLLILDLDVHQGDGTAVCLAGDDRAFTVSVHAERNFPARKARSSVDVPLADGTGDEAYLALLAESLPRWIDAARPDLLLLQAGVDPHADDRLGRLALTDAGLAQREEQVRDAARSRGLPLAATMGGGYGDPAAVGARHARSLAILAGLGQGGLPA